jgi:ribosomal protein L6P/L9E
MIKLYCLNGFQLKIIYKKKNLIIFYGPLGFNVVKYAGILHISKKKNLILMLLNSKFLVFYTNLINTIKKNIFIGFRCYLEVIGTGYKIIQLGEQSLQLEVGFSHNILFLFSKKFKINVLKNKFLKIFGINLQTVTQVASQIKNFKKPEPYKGKGLRYLKEYIQLKQGKKKKK